MNGVTRSIVVFALAWIAACGGATTTKSDGVGGSAGGSAGASLGSSGGPRGAGGGGGQTEGDGVSDACVLNSDCTSPLVCGYGNCHVACETSRDCPRVRCMVGNGTFHICQLPEQTVCAYSSDCPAGQVCGSDRQCRDHCAADRDCVAGQLCVSGMCAEPAELVDGGLPGTR